MSALFIILVSLRMILFSEKMLISNRWISGLMSNLIKKSWKVSSPHSPVRIMTQVPWFMYQNRLGPSGGIYYPNFAPCFVLLYLNVDISQVWKTISLSSPLLAHGWTLHTCHSVRDNFLKSLLSLKPNFTQVLMHIKPY